MTTLSRIKKTNEKEIQKNILNYIKQYGGFKVLEEEFKILKGFFQRHNLLLVDKYEDYFNGLSYHVERLNDNLFNKYPHIDREIILSKILNDFISKYDDCKDNVSVYQLVFERNASNRRVVIDEKTNKEEHYNIVDLLDSNRNEITIIREKRIEGTKGVELPDFAAYINGIPLIAIEVKTTDSGLDRAFSDYKVKETYRKFILGIGTTGEEAFISSSPSSLKFYKWEEYGDNKNPLHANGMEALFSEFLFNKKNLMFYLKYGIFLAYTSGGEPFLMNQRVQQYFVLKKLYTKFTALLNSNLSKKALMSEIVKHTQRSGKSISIKSVVNLLANEFSQSDRKLFSKIYVCVPDKTIHRGIKNTFGDMEIYGTGYPIQILNTRSDYAQSIESKSNLIDVYLMNVQKISEDQNIDMRYSDNDVLIIIDEVHTHQMGKNADVRSQNFPNASYLVFTATPKIKTLYGVIRDYTADTYSSNTYEGQDRYLDELRSSEAIALNIVLPVVYEKAKFEQYWNRSLNADFDGEIYNKFKHIVDTDIRIQEYIDDLVGKHERQLIGSGIGEEELETKLALYRHQKEMREIDRLMGEATGLVADEVRAAMMPIKINFIVNDFKEKQRKVYSDPKTKNPYFRQKAFLVVRRKDEAESYINTIRTLSGGSNTYQGLRFGVDYSESQHSTSTSESRLAELNGDLRFGNKIIDDFESERDGSVDVLIIVDKYLMGYDCENLVAVYCDKEIGEHSKLYQLITRPATKRKYKAKGFFIDLSLGNNNYDTYKKSLSLYDNKEGIETFILDDERAAEETQNIQSRLFDIRVLLRLQSEQTINDSETVFAHLKALPLDSQMEYFTLFKDMNNSFKILVKPEYYMDHVDSLYSLLTVNYRYKVEILDKLQEEYLHYNRNEIRAIIEDTLRIFNLNSVDDIVRFDLIGKEERHYTDEELELDTKNKELGRLRISLNWARTPIVSRTFFEQCEIWSQKLILGNVSDVNEIIDINSQIEKEKERIKSVIESTFNGNKSHYMMHETLKLFFESKVTSDNLDIFEDICFGYTKVLSDVIESQNINTDKIYEIDSHIEEYVKSLINKMPRPEASGYLQERMKESEDYKTVSLMIFRDFHKDENAFEEVLGDSIYATLAIYESGELD